MPCSIACLENCANQVKTGVVNLMEIRVRESSRAACIGLLEGG